MHETAIDVDDKIAIGGVLGLEHDVSNVGAEFPVFKSGFCATVEDVTRTLTTIEETIALGREIAGSLGSGAVIALVGDLGAGKTHLTKGIVAGLVSSAEVTSPTFTLVHEYSDGRLPVFHFDFYRLDHPDELLAIGWDEYCESDGVVIVEWADKFPDLIPDGATWWILRIDGEARWATSEVRYDN
ncbi:MAG: tRNA (adenosine(37)-N6)-threonylcarbamoyltransferase complex ATPase subunit type 1 TsaE [Verrucomicrobiota bacterium]